MEAIIIQDALFILINVGILALNIKLYTEIMKERNMNRRAENGDHWTTGTT